VLPLWAALLFAAASGPIMDAGFPDGYLWPLTFAGIALVLVSLIGRRPRSALLVGFVAGLAFYFIHIDWVSLFLGPLPMTALSVLESLFVAVGALLISLAYRWCAALWSTGLGRLGMLPLVVSGIWTAREAIESVWPYGGFAWGRVAISQSEGPLAHLFSWIGISGVTFVMVWIVALAVEAVRLTSFPRLARVTVAVAAIALAVVVPAFPVALQGTSTIAAVQGNGKAAYFDSRQPGDLLTAQLRATEPLFGTKVDMVVWPEGGSDLDPLEDATAARVFDLVSEQMNAPLIAGTITQRGELSYNTSLLWKAGEGVTDYYDKKHPVPFGEYVPNRAFWEPFAPDLIGLIGREYTPGTTDTVFDINGVIAGINICFDITDDDIMRTSVQEGAQVILAQTNNADFGKTDESVQQLAIARIRAMELGRTVVNVSTVGTSAMIRPDGSTIVQLPTYTAAAMVETVPLSTTVTPASIAGKGIEYLVGGFGLFAVLVAGLAARSPRPRRVRARG